MNERKPTLYQYHILIQIVHGIILTFAFHPFDIFLAIPMSFSGFLWCLEKHCVFTFNGDIRDPILPFIKTRNKRLRYFYIGFCHGLAFFIAHFVTSLYWLVNPLLTDVSRYWFAIPFVMLIPILLASFYAVMSGIICVFVNLKLLLKKSAKQYNASTRVKIAFAFAAAFSVTEIVRSHSIFTFPWNLLGCASGYSIGLMQVCSVVGVYGLSLLLYTVGMVPYTRQLGAISVVAMVMLSVTMWGNKRLNDATVQVSNSTNKIFVHVVQPNIVERHNYDYRRSMLALEKTTKLVEEIGSSLIPRLGTTYRNFNAKHTTHLIIFPESGIPFTIDKDEETLLEEFMQAYDTNTFLITGVDRYVEREHKYYNSIIMINNEGEIIDSYDKNTLVPFGEYIPMQKYLGWFVPIVNNVASFSPGIHARNIRLYSKNNSEDKILNRDFFVIIPTVCYESILDPITHPRYNTDANMIINLTNDSWLGNSIGPYQHLAMARIRAIEYGVPMVRAATNGISAVIDSHGRIIKLLHLNEEGVINTLVPEHRENTIYMEFINMIYRMN